jgi:hypothetical protein
MKRAIIRCLGTYYPCQVEQLWACPIIAATEATSALAPAKGASSTGLTWGCDINANLAAIHLPAIHSLAGSIGLVLGGHGDEAIATRASGLAVDHHNGIADGPEFRELVVEGLGGGGPGKLTNIQFVRHAFQEESCRKRVQFWCLTPQPRSNIKFFQAPRGLHNREPYIKQAPRPRRVSRIVGHHIIPPSCEYTCRLHHPSQSQRLRRRNP